MSKKSIKIILQKNLLQHLGKDYSAFVLARETSWTKESTNLAKTILWIICHTEINKGKMKDLAENTKILAAKTLQTPKRICSTQEYIDIGIITHIPDRC